LAQGITRLRCDFPAKDRAVDMDYLARVNTQNLDKYSSSLT